tara:strand:- start:149 stop:391 length:243 start_codon:yes stop_codon:yes gene_type:complete
LADHQEDVATVSKVPGDSQLNRFAWILVLLTRSNPAAQTHPTMAHIDVSTVAVVVPKMKLKYTHRSLASHPHGTQNKELG